MTLKAIPEQYRVSIAEQKFYRHIVKAKLKRGDVAELMEAVHEARLTAEHPYLRSISRLGRDTL